MDTKEIFGKRLKSAREMKGLSMADLVGEMENIVSRQAIYKYEAGKMLPDSSVLIKLAEVLGVNVGYLFRPFSISLSGIEFRKKAKMSEKARKSVQQKVMDHVERYFEIEDIAGVPIDHSFLSYKKELPDYGFRVGKISMKEQTVAFEESKA